MNKIMRRFLAILFLLSIFVVFSSCNRSDPQVPRKESESKITDSDVEIINSIKECVVQIWVGQEDLSLEAKGTGFFVSKDGVCTEPLRLDTFLAIFSSHRGPRLAPFATAPRIQPE
jgi:hypothetical protein